MSHVAPTIKLTQKQENILTKISTSRSLPKSLITRAQIILHASKGLQNKEISPKVSCILPVGISDIGVYFSLSFLCFKQRNSYYESQRIVRST